MTNGIHPTMETLENESMVTLFGVFACSFEITIKISTNYNCSQSLYLWCT